MPAEFGLCNGQLNELALVAWANREATNFFSEGQLSDIQRGACAEAREVTYVDLETGEFSEANYENDIPAAEAVMPDLDIHESIGASSGDWYEALLWRGAFLDQLFHYGYETRDPVAMPGAYGPTGFGGVKFVQSKRGK